MPSITEGKTITDSAQIAPGIIVDSDVNAAANIAASKLQALSVGVNGGVLPSTGVANAHVASDAAIALSKLAAIIQGGVLVGGPSNVPTDLGAGTSGYYLKSNGAGATPSWAAVDKDWIQLDDVSSAGASSLSTSTFSARKVLRVLILGMGFSGNAYPKIQFNGDTGNNYGTRLTQNGGASTDVSSADHIRWSAGNFTDPYFITMDIHNGSSSIRKIYSGIATLAYNSVATQPEVVTYAGVWGNTSAQITSVTLSASANNLNSGTRIIVYGKND